jgi:branched-chain amino acid transport system substrate-binding protein
MRVIFVLGSILFLLLSPSVWAADTVNIVHIDPFSGPFKELGDRHNLGVKFAVDEINAAGGLLGKKVILNSEDSQLKPDVAARKAEKSIMQENSRFIISNISTAVARSLMQVSQKYKVIHMTNAAYTSSLTGEDWNPYFFRICYNTEIYSRAFAAYFKTQPYRKFYMLNQDYAYGHAVADDFRKAMKREIPDVEFVGDDFHPTALKDFAPYITKIISSKAEVLYTGDWGIDLEVLMKQASQMGLKAKWASNQLDDHVVLSNIGNAAIGAHCVSMYLPTIETKENKTFLEKWNSKFKGTNTPWPTNPIGYVYNGTKFFFEAVKKAGSLEPEAIIKAWENMEYDGVTGRVLMRGCDHQLVQPLFFSEIVAKSDFYPFPYNGKPAVIPREKAAVPPAETGNPRCK